MKRIVVLLLVTVLALALAAPSLAAKPDKPNIKEAVFIHYEHPAKLAPPPPPAPKVYDYFLLLGPKWDLAKYPTGVPYVINPTGAPAGAEAEVKKSFETWDAATSSELFNNSPFIDLASWWGTLDGKNNVSWQVLASGSIIAGTWIWYDDKDNSGGMSDGDEILETDIVFNKTMKWGIDADGEGTAFKLTKAYDVANIGTHEVGHVVGLDDFYNTIYSEITMYGYSSKAETKKISLEIGDRNGTASLYGS